MSAIQAWFKQHRRPLTKWTVIVVIALLVAIPYMSDNNGNATPYDPTSADPDGTKGFALLMQQAGATFTVDSKPGTGTAVLLNDTLTNTEADRIETWVRGGGRLIVADPRSSLVASSATAGDKVHPLVLKPDCNASYVNGVTSVRPNTIGNYTLFERDSGTVNACFRNGDGYLVSEHRVGLGTIVDVGSADLFTNQDLANFDNAVLVTNLMKPTANSRIVWLQTTDTNADADSSSGGSSMSELLPDNVKGSILQLALAGLVLILWRSRRLGKPVDEDQLVQISGSQLVVATGNLLQTARRSDDAAAMMRHDVKRSFASLLGLDPNIPDAALVSLLHDRTNIDAERIESVLFGLPANDDAQLIALSQQLEYLYMEVSRVR